MKKQPIFQSKNPVMAFFQKTEAEQLKYWEEINRQAGELQKNYE